MELLVVGANPTLAATKIWPSSSGVEQKY